MVRDPSTSLQPPRKLWRGKQDDKKGESSRVKGSASRGGA